MNESDLAQIQANQLNLDLFGLDPMLDKNYSNTLEIYDLSGKFIYDKQNKYLSSASADETEFTRISTYQNIDLKVSVTAANIERTLKDGTKQRAFVFPGAREEIIEDVLRKLATERRAEAYQATSGTDAGAKFIGITFTMYEVFEELKRVGKSYSYSEIREALTIMNRSILSFQTMDGSLDLSAPFFPITAIAERGNREDTRSFVCFHPMVTSAIENLNFRRYNYVKALQFNRHYTRLTYKRLCHRWVQASPDKPYTILLSTLVSAMKTAYPNLYQEKALFKAVLDDLVEADVLAKYEMHAKKIGKKITDWRLTLHASNNFAKQIAANNKVANAMLDLIPGSLPTHPER